MIDKFGRIMLYVNDVQKASEFWCEKVKFTKIDESVFEEKLISVELCPYEKADTYLVLFDKEFVRATSDIPNLGSPSFLFSTYDINETHQQFKDNGINVSEIMDMGGLIHFTFTDLEDNHFAIREIDKQ